MIYELDQLTSKGVSVKTTKEFDKGEVCCQSDLLAHRKAYLNSTDGRVELNELPDNIKQAILSVWGEATAITDEQA